MRREYTRRLDNCLGQQTRALPVVELVCRADDRLVRSRASLRFHGDATAADAAPIYTLRPRLKGARGCKFCYSVCSLRCVASRRLDAGTSSTYIGSHRCCRASAVDDVLPEAVELSSAWQAGRQATATHLCGQRQPAEAQSSVVLLPALQHHNVAFVCDTCRHRVTCTWHLTLCSRRV